MENLPLHPALVHIPLAIAFLLPVVVGVVLVGHRLGRWGRGGWITVSTIAAVLLVSSIVALRSGEAEEEQVEEVVSESALETHEERAEVFTWTVAALFALTVLIPLTSRKTLREGGGLGVLALSAVVTFLALRVGEAGGTLVYREGAPLAYLDGQTPCNAAVADGDHEEQERDER